MIAGKKVVGLTLTVHTLYTNTINYGLDNIIWVISAIYYCIVLFGNTN